MKTPIIMFLDIEATDLNADMGNIISITFRFNHWKKAKTKKLSILSHPGKKINDDTEVLKAFEPYYLKADLIVHHFGDYYDVPYIHTRRLINKLSPMPKANTFDTWKAARKFLKFSRNTLDNIATMLDCPYKKTFLDRKIWRDARIGDIKAIRYIVFHNHIDVLIEEFVYYKLRSFGVHPKLFNNTNNNFKCPYCGETKSKAHTATPSQRRLCLRCSRTWVIPKNKKGKKK